MKLKTSAVALTAATLTGTHALANAADSKPTVTLAAKDADSYQHIRNATGRLNYAGKTFLIDPMLSKKGAFPGFEGTFNSQQRNPTVELPMNAEDTFKDVDAIIVTHTHLDHWDEAAQKILPKSMKIFVQHARDGELLKSQGFTNIESLSLEQGVKFGDITLYKTGGAHGTTEMYANPQIAERLNEAMGVVFEAKGHKPVYLVGDTVWTADVNKALNRFKPEIVILNTGDARLIGLEGGIIMGKEDVVHARQVLPNAKLIAVHMDAVNHMTVSRADLRQYLKGYDLEANVAIPEDGEVVKF